MPVLGVDDERAAGSGGSDLVVDELDRIVSASDVQRALRVGEVVLNVDDEQRGRPVPFSHG